MISEVPKPYKPLIRVPYYDYTTTCPKPSSNYHGRYSSTVMRAQHALQGFVPGMLNRSIYATFLNFGGRGGSSCALLQDRT